ncbi:hypothetical protein OHB12_16695 [Nocardia sp. NBC_01730]|nr:hypothetical protein OHB12_16695 [Nocardia sp. NBC_01730]
MQDGTREADDAACRRDHRVTSVIAEVTDPVPSFHVLHVWNDVMCSCPGVGQQIYGAVGFGDVIEGDPTCEIGSVAVVDEARVLVPTELHAPLGSLDNVLLVEQVRGLAQCRLRDLDHEVADQKLSDGGAAVVGVDEVAATTMIEVQPVDAEPIHFCVAFIDQALAFIAKSLQIVRTNGVLKDEESVITESTGVLCCDR